MLYDTQEDVMPKYVWTPEIEEVLFRSLENGQTLLQICKRIGIGRTTVYDRKREDEAFAEQLARACEAGEGVLEDEILDIADNGTNDYVTRMNGDGEIVEELDRDHIQRSKLRIYAREKILAWKNPRRYGTGRLDLTTGGNALPTTDAEAMATRMASILAEGEARRRVAEGEE